MHRPDRACFHDLLGPLLDEVGPVADVDVPHDEHELGSAPQTGKMAALHEEDGGELVVRLWRELSLL